jgi:endonuclease/exonuclease/phosphatase family metal-dependent hydrolase
MWHVIRIGVVVTAAMAVLGGCNRSSPTGPGGTGPQFTVATFNIQHGLSGAGRYDLRYSSETIAKLNPDLVGLQELTRNHPAYNCDDQPVRIAERVSGVTGRPWSGVYRQEWLTQIRDCPNTGRGDGPATEGLGYLAPGSLAPPTFTTLPISRLGLLSDLTVAGRRIPVVNTHLAHGSGAGPASQRLQQIPPLLSWSLNQAAGGPIVLIGDFNHRPDAEEYARIRAAGFRDAWEDAVAAGTARGRLDGITKGSSRIDYIFYIPAGVLELLWMENVDTRGLIGAQASDHNPLIAAFSVR